MSVAFRLVVLACCALVRTKLAARESRAGIMILVCSPVITAYRSANQPPRSPPTPHAAGIGRTQNRNAAIFPVDDPTMTPLIADATIVVVNDARHQLEGNFLQRTVPYFFELTGGNPTVASGGRYRWAKVRAYVSWSLI